MKHTINIMPSFVCNYDCGYCYLKGTNYGNSILSLSRIKEMLDEYTSHFKTTLDNTTIDIYGGEVTLLPRILKDKDYLVNLFKLACKYSNNINIISNLTYFEEISRVYESLTDDEVGKFGYSTSLLNRERSEWQSDLMKVSMITPSPKSILVVVTRDIYRTKPEKLLEMLNSTGATSVTFLQLVNSKTNYFEEITNEEYSKKIRFLIEVYLENKYSFTLGNITRLEECLREEYNPSDDKVIYFMPSGKYGGLTITEREEFIEYDNLDTAININKSMTEFVEYLSDCDKCEFYKKCAADHIKVWRNNDVCCGFKNLLKWYKDNIFKGNK